MMWQMVHIEQALDVFNKCFFSCITEACVCRHGSVVRLFAVSSRLYTVELHVRCRIGTQ